MKLLTLLESFDQPYPWKWTRRGDSTNSFWKAVFTTSKNHAVMVDIAQEFASSHYEVAFTRNDSIDITNEGDAYKIYATVIDILKTFLSYGYATSLVFISEKGKGSREDTSRTKLYERMVKTLAKKYDWKFRIDKTKPRNDYFEIYKDET